MGRQQQNRHKDRATSRPEQEAPAGALGWRERCPETVEEVRKYGLPGRFQGQGQGSEVFHDKQDKSEQRSWSIYVYKVEPGKERKFKECGGVLLRY